ncbi:hypothetical protein BGW42_003744 [Actinomortierella wolfii]|nr:hypothetical protein BGW42_003744 [Actinomortierella wolfii]
MDDIIGLEWPEDNDIEGEDDISVGATQSQEFQKTLFNTELRKLGEVPICDM